MKLFDIIIIGGGPAGLTAAIYSARGGMKVALLERMSLGGQAALTDEIANYPGYESINGYELSEKMQAQAVSFGTEIIYAEATSIEVDGEYKLVKTADDEFKALAVIIATGCKPKTIGIDEPYIGRGVGYCATCDGNFYRNLDVGVIGGGNTAVADAVYLSKICNKVYLIHRRDKFRASVAEVSRLRASSNIELVLNSEVESIVGSEQVEGVVVVDKQMNKKEISLSGLFVAVGQTPLTDFVKEVVQLDRGYIVADRRMRTSVEGIFACGDATVKELRQVVTACSDGAVAAEEAQAYISDKF